MRAIRCIQIFQDLVYPVNRPIEARDVFDSYRLSWYRRLAPRGQWSFRLGALNFAFFHYAVAGVRVRF